MAWEKTSTPCGRRRQDVHPCPQVNVRASVFRVLDWTCVNMSNYALKCWVSTGWLDPLMRLLKSLNFIRNPNINFRCQTEKWPIKNCGLKCLRDRKTGNIRSELELHCNVMSVTKHLFAANFVKYPLFIQFEGGLTTFYLATVKCKAVIWVALWCLYWQESSGPSGRKIVKFLCRMENI